MTDFGPDGPYASRSGYDFLIQLMSGIMSLTGEPDGASQKKRVAFADIFKVYKVSSASKRSLQSAIVAGLVNRLIYHFWTA